MDRVCCPLADTRHAPDSGPTVASRTTMIVGNTVYGAAVLLRKALEEFASSTLFQGEPVALADGVFTGAHSRSQRSFDEVAGQHLAERGPLRLYHQFQLPPTIQWDQQTFRGDSYPSYSWGCNVAEVEVDTLTCALRVTRVFSCWDIGRVINPMLAQGQIEGGLVQALGYAVMEKIGITKDGLYDAARMQTYVVPTALDVPEFDVQFLEFPYTHGAPGAKGVGEIPMDGLAPAIANAVYAATGLRFRDLPITPEKIFAALHHEKL